VRPAEQKRLVDLLGKVLNEAHRANKDALVKHSLAMLYALGAQVHVGLDDQDTFWVARSK
jgi:hypothetical protein